VRLDEQPWDDDERTVIDRVNDALGETSNGSWALPRARRTTLPPLISLTNHRAGQAEQTGPRLLGIVPLTPAPVVSPDPGGATEGDLATPRRSPIGRQVNASRIPASGVPDGRARSGRALRGVIRPRCSGVPAERADPGKLAAAWAKATSPRCADSTRSRVAARRVRRHGADPPTCARFGDALRDPPRWCSGYTLSFLRGPPRSRVRHLQATACSTGKEPR
jgi:hypothetical protein